MCLSIKRKIWIQFSSVLSEIIKEQNVFLVFTQWPLFWWKFFQLCFWNQNIKFSWINFRHRFILYNLLFIYEHADLFGFDLKKSSSGLSRGLLITHSVSNHALLCFILCILIRLRLILIRYNKSTAFDATQTGLRNVINHQNRKWSTFCWWISSWYYQPDSTTFIFSNTW